MLCCTLNGLYVRGVRALRGTGRVFVSTSFSAFSVFCMCRRRGRLSYGSGRLPPPELGGRLALFSKDVRWYPASPCVCARFCQLVTDIRGCPPRLPRSPPLCRLHHASSRQYPAATSTARQPPPTSTASSGAYMFGPLAHARLQRGCTTTTSTWPNFVRFHPTVSCPPPRRHLRGRPRFSPRFLSAFCIWFGLLRCAQRTRRTALHAPHFERAKSTQNSAFCPKRHPVARCGARAGFARIGRAKRGEESESWKEKGASISGRRVTLD